MATVYSLICWGGRTGKSVTASNSSGLIFTTSAAHGLRDATALQFTATTLPGNVAANTTYYAKVLSSTTFSVYTESSLTNRVAWSSSGSAVYAKSKKMIDYLAANSGRWGASGSERCYDTLSSFVSARNSNYSQFDSDVCEIGEGFDDYQSSTLNISYQAASLYIGPYVNGSLTNAFHYGKFGANGYRIVSSTGGRAINLSWYGQTIDGISIECTNSSGSGIAINTMRSVCKRTMLKCSAASPTGVGLSLDAAAGSFAFYNVISGFWSGIQAARYGSGQMACNNIVVKNAQYGFYITYGGSELYGFWKNNIAFGNGINWYNFGVGGGEQAANNYGAAGDARVPWTTTGNSYGTISSSDFVNYGSATPSDTDDFRPASSTSPQVESGIGYYEALTSDVSGHIVPDYMNGASAILDVGAYEYDHGYGNHPATATISLSNIVSGSRVLITRDDTSAVLYNDVPGSSLSFVTGYIGNFSVVIRKASESPYYREFSAGGTTVADQTTSIKALQQLDE